MAERELSARPTYAGYVMQAQREISPRPMYGQPPSGNSPKRPLRFYGDEESESERPRKVQRGESPLKGAAGRRLDQAKRMHGGPQQWERAAPVASIPRDITFLLSIIPRAEDYTAKYFVPERMVELLARTRVPEYGEWKRERESRGLGAGQGGYM